MIDFCIRYTNERQLKYNFRKNQLLRELTRVEPKGQDEVDTSVTDESSCSCSDDSYVYGKNLSLGKHDYKTN